jgi:hypothetical protein
LKDNLFFRKIFLVFIPLIIIGTVVASSSDVSSFSQSVSGTTPVVPPGNRFIRIRAWEGGWALPGYNAQEVLAMISYLKPNALERYISSGFNPDQNVPVAPGEPPMTILQFLNASLQACAPENCYIIPRISLDDYNSGKLYNESLEYLNLPVYPKIRFLSLDDWSQFSQRHTPEQIQTMFQTLYAQGWEGIGVNDVGGYYTAYGYASFVDFGITTGAARNPWIPNLGTLAQIQADPSIKRALLYIDFPDQMMSFNNSLTADQEASVLLHNISSIQASENFTFVFPIIQSFWDSTLHLTSKNSSWSGATIYKVEKQLMDEFNPSSISKSSTKTTTTIISTGTNSITSGTESSSSTNSSSEDITNTYTTYSRTSSSDLTGGTIDPPSVANGFFG